MGISNPRIVLAGSVSSSEATLRALLKSGAQVVGVLGLDASVAEPVSGYVSLEKIAAEYRVPFRPFTKINDPEILAIVRDWRPDLFFVAGLSQLVKKELLATARLGAVGFHPTCLPRGRGRAPLAWLVLESAKGPVRGSANFFWMDEGVDSGPILAQEPFTVHPHDDAHDVNERICEAIGVALARWVPGLIRGEWAPVDQDHSKASYLGKRDPSDGCIDWSQPAHEIYALIRATARPHPGAYTYFKDRKLVIWRAEPYEGVEFKGVTGRVLLVEADASVVVQAGDRPLRLRHFEFEAATEAPKLTVGSKLGFSTENEIAALKQRVRELEILVRDSVTKKE